MTQLQATYPGRGCRIFWVAERIQREKWCSLLQTNGKRETESNEHNLALLARWVTRWVTRGLPASNPFELVTKWVTTSVGYEASFFIECLLVRTCGQCYVPMGRQTTTENKKMTTTTCSVPLTSYVGSSGASKCFSVVAKIAVANGCMFKAICRIQQSQPFPKDNHSPRNGCRSCPFAILIGASDRAGKLHSTGANSMSNGHDLPLLRSSPMGHS